MRKAVLEPDSDLVIISQIGFPRKQILRKRLPCRMFMKESLGINACGTGEKEAGLGKGEVEWSPKALSQSHGSAGGRWPPEVC